IKKRLLTYVVKVDAQRQPSATSKYKFNWKESSDPQGKYSHPDRSAVTAIFGSEDIVRVYYETMKDSIEMIISLFYKGIREHDQTASAIIFTGGSELIYRVFEYVLRQWFGDACPKIWDKFSPGELQFKYQ
ncbi:unnamed protein product, partial [Clonostachys rhizophaga]